VVEELRKSPMEVIAFELAAQKFQLARALRRNFDICAVDRRDKEAEDIDCDRRPD
jgi:hypothetical protein